MIIWGGCCGRRHGAAPATGFAADPGKCGVSRSAWLHGWRPGDDTTCGRLQQTSQMLCKGWSVCRFGDRLAVIEPGGPIDTVAADGQACAVRTRRAPIATENRRLSDAGAQFVI